MNAKQLRNSILQLAIQGKLVPQDPNDEPASVLLDKIRAEKRKLVKEGVLKKKDLEETPISDDEKPFEIPEGWEWCRHNVLFNISGGSQPPKSDFIYNEKEGYIRLYQIRDYGDSPSPVYIPIEKANKISQKGDILLARYGGSLGKVFYAEDGAYNVAMAKVEFLFKPETIYKKFIYLYYHSRLYQNLVKNSGNRSAQGGFNKDDLASLLFPLPPLAEQQRIVAKLEEILPIVDEYGKAQEEANNLQAELPDKLRKSILQEAIQGKLVPQDPNDEPASVLLDKIRAEKKRLVKEGVLKKGELKEIPLTEEDYFCDIPKSWVWTKMGNIGSWGAGATPMRGNPDYYGGDIPWLKTGELNNGIVSDSEEKVTKKALEKCSLRLNQPGDVMIAMYGATIGKLGIAGKTLTTNQACCACTPILIYNWFLFYYLMACKEAFIKLGAGGAQPNISRDKLVNYPIPLPPLAEQHRIVSRIEEMFKAIDALKNDNY